MKLKLLKYNEQQDRELLGKYVTNCSTFFVCDAERDFNYSFHVIVHPIIINSC